MNFFLLNKWDYQPKNHSILLLVDPHFDVLAEVAVKNMDTLGLNLIHPDVPR